jgi:hypothetical protein
MTGWYSMAEKDGRPIRHRRRRMSLDSPRGQGTRSTATGQTVCEQETSPLHCRSCFLADGVCAYRLENSESRRADPHFPTLQTRPSSMDPHPVLTPARDVNPSKAVTPLPTSPVPTERRTMRPTLLVLRKLVCSPSPR